MEKEIRRKPRMGNLNLPWPRGIRGRRRDRQGRRRRQAQHIFRPWGNGRFGRRGTGGRPCRDIAFFDVPAPKDFPRPAMKVAEDCEVLGKEEKVFLWRLSLSLWGLYKRGRSGSSQWGERMRITILGRWFGEEWTVGRGRCGTAGYWVEMEEMGVELGYTCGRTKMSFWVLWSNLGTGSWVRVFFSERALARTVENIGIYFYDQIGIIYVSPLANCLNLWSEIGCTSPMVSSMDRGLIWVS